MKFEIEMTDNEFGGLLLYTLVLLGIFAAVEGILRYWH